MCPKRLLLYFIYGAFTVSVLFGSKMAIEGLPLHRQEPDSDQDILAGADFLSVFLESSLRRAYAETTPTPTPLPTTTILVAVEEEAPIYTTRRSKRNSHSPFQQHGSLTQSTEQFSVSDSSTDRDGVVAISVSTSVGRSTNNIYRRRTTVQPSPTYFSSEQHPSLVAKASKSELSAEESEPITKDSEVASDYSRGYQASVRVIPDFDQTSSFINQNLPQGNKPFQPTVIYHDNSGEVNSARSVSYSSIIQAIPQIPIEVDKSEPHERRERNYNDAKTPYSNSFDSSEEKRKQNDTRPSTWQKNRSGPTKDDAETVAESKSVYTDDTSTGRAAEGLWSTRAELRSRRGFKRGD